MKKLLFTIFAALLFLPVSTQAATFESGDQINFNKVINDDIYVAGESISLNADINGDFISAGGQVLFDGTVSQDSTIIAGSTVIKGIIDDDLRVASGTTNLIAIVKGDVLAATGSLIIDSDSFIGGDLIAVAGEAVISGNINGDVRIAGDHDGHLNINGVIGGSVKIIGFGPNAKILGDLSYKASEAIDLPEGLVGGEVIFKQKEIAEISNKIPGIVAGFSLFGLLSTLFFGLFFIWLFRYFAINSVGRSYEATLKSLGVGFLFVVLTPIAVIILIVTTIGIPLALVSLMAWLIILYLGKIGAAMIIGYKIIHIDNKSKFGRIYGGFALGTLIYTLIGLVPLVGWVVNFLFVLIALGGMISHKIEVCSELRKKKLC